MRIMLVGGGTGGHFYPLIAIAEAIRKRDQQLNRSTELWYIGPAAYNGEALERLSIPFVYCPAGKQRRYRSVLNFFDKFKVLAGILVAIVKLYWLYPDVIMSKGGYTSVPVVLAAAFLHIPIVIHESDSVAGRANRLASRFARYIAVSYDDAAQFFPTEKVAFTGQPMQQTFFTKSSDPHAQLGLPTNYPVILVTGGSLGAERINNLILDSLDELLPQYTIVHQVGDTHLEAITKTARALITDEALMKRYFLLGRLSPKDFAAAQDAATLVISRAGSTIFEIALKGKPSIIIPIPEAISHDQRNNAYAYARSGAASVIEEKNLTDGLLVAEITRIMTEPGAYETMSQAAVRFTRPDAADTLAATLLGIGGEHE